MYAGFGQGLKEITWEDGKKEPLQFWYMPVSRPYYPNPKDAGEAMAADLAKAGNGLYHFAANAASIPTIFAEETTLATRAYIIEEEFFPQAAQAVGSAAAASSFSSGRMRRAAHTLSANRLSGQS